jgi:VWFA-related protein
MTSFASSSFRVPAKRFVFICVLTAFAVISALAIPQQNQNPSSPPKPDSPPSSTQDAAPAAAPPQSPASSPSTDQSTPPSQAAPPSSSPAPSSDNAPEMATHETSSALKVPVNLVLVRVVIRDGSGHPVGNLKKEDFQLFDNRKAQSISHFIADSPVAASAPGATSSGSSATSAPGATSPAAPFSRPARYIGLLFDDVHSSRGDLMLSRNAADRYLTKSTQPSDRIAVYTISGQGQVDFTDDAAKLHAGLANIQVRNVGTSDATGDGDCPAEDYYEADQIANSSDATALAVATNDALQCAFNGDTRMESSAQGLAMAEAFRVVSAGELQTEFSFRRLEEVVKRMAALPGQRSVVFVSPGFLIIRHESELVDIVDRAARANVQVNTLDARGLYTPDQGDDVSLAQTGDPVGAPFRAQYHLTAQRMQGDVLEELADGTGASYFHNNNDLDQGFRMVAQSPEYSYLLGFSPVNLKNDGKYHALKVTLTTKEKYLVQARRGYYAPRHSADPTQLAKQELEEAVFSQEELHDIPADLKTQFYKVDTEYAKLAVLAHVDIGHLRFRKENDRNRDDLTVVAAIFDRNGNYVTGNEKILEMRLRDATLVKLERSGVTLRTSFDVKPGDYVVRLVVRDSEAAQLAAANTTVQIPY